MVSLDVHFSSKTDEWATPQDIFDSYNSKYNFDTDVAASKTNAKVLKYFDQYTNGLEQPWGKRNWCNPPYSQLKLWIKKAAAEQKRGNLTVMLIPARTDTIAFHEHIYNKPDVDIQFLKGRLKFGNSKNSAPFPSMVVTFNPL